MLAQLTGMTTYIAVYYPLNRLLFASLRRHHRATTLQHRSPR